MKSVDRSAAMPRPFSMRVMAAIAGLTLLFTVLAPEASEPLGFPGRLLFWFLHIALGLAAALLAARAMIVSFAVPRDWRLILFSGVAGVLLFAPVAYLLELLFPVVPLAAAGEDADMVASSGTLTLILVEAMELAPSFLAAWFVVNLEPLSAVLSSRAAISDDGQQPGDPTSGRRAFLERLPAAIGTELIAVSSDLHYLQVYTRYGQAMVLGSLQEVEEALGPEGLRVHRSHWVVADRVRRLRQKGRQSFVEMEDGRLVAVSRRRKSEVVRRLGRGFRREAEAVPD